MSYIPDGYIMYYMFPSQRVSDLNLANSLTISVPQLVLCSRKPTDMTRDGIPTYDYIRIEDLK